MRVKLAVSFSLCDLRSRFTGPRLRTCDVRINFFPAREQTKTVEQQDDNKYNYRVHRVVHRREKPMSLCSSGVEIMKFEYKTILRDRRRPCVAYTHFGETSVWR